MGEQTTGTTDATGTTEPPQSESGSEEGCTNDDDCLQGQHCGPFSQVCPNDGMIGWTYDPATNSITFHGQACSHLQTGAITDIDIVYGCNSLPAG